MKSNYVSLILISLILTFCKENKKKKKDLTEEKINKKSQKSHDKHYVIKTHKTEEEMNKLFSGSSLEDLKSIEKNKKLEKKSKKENSKEEKKHFIISQTDDKNQTLEEDDDDENRPFDDFLLREIIYINDIKEDNSKINLLQINNLNDNSFPFKYKVGYVIIYVLIVFCLLLFGINFFYSKKIHKEFSFEEDGADTYLLVKN